MPKLVTCAVLLCLAVLAVRAEESDVVTLTDSTFDTLVTPDSGSWLIEFYAPWCGHCKKLAPTWEELATSAKGQFKVAKVDCTVEKAAGTRFGIRGFPTVKFFQGGKVYDYRGPRTVADFTAFATGGYSTAESSPVPPAAAAAEAPKAAAPATETKPAAGGAAAPAGAGDVVVLTDATFASSIEKGIWLVKFYAPWCGHCKKLAPTWDELATAAKGKFNVAKVDCTVEKDVAAKQSVPGYPTVKLFKDGKLVKEYQGPRTIEGFTKFVEQEAGKEEL